MKTAKPFKKQIKGECGAEGCKMGLIVGKYPENKIKNSIKKINEYVFFISFKPPLDYVIVIEFTSINLLLSPNFK